MTISRNLSIHADYVSTAGVLNPAGGGTGITSTPANGQLPIGNGTNYTAATITAGTGISVTNGAGTITIANTSTVSTTFGAVGTYAFAIYSGTASVSGGSTVSGGSLYRTSMQCNFSITANSQNSTANSPDGNTLSGTWQCMGYSWYNSAVPSYGTTLWLRTA